LLSGKLNLPAALRILRIDGIRVVFIKQSAQEDDTMFIERALNTILRWQICFAAAILICYVLRLNWQ
jgi:hypothetical protein